MEETQRTRTIIIIIAVIILLLLAILLCRGCSGFQEASPNADPTKGSPAEPMQDDGLVSPGLVGKWIGSSAILGDISVVIEKVAPVQDSDESSQYVTGYVIYGGDPSGDPIAPLAGVAVPTGADLYEVQIWSTNLSPVIEGEAIEDVQVIPVLFTGSVNTNVGQVEGIWQSGEETGDWQMEFDTEEVPNSPVFDLENSGLSVNYELMVSIHTTDQNSGIDSQYVQLDASTNVAVSDVVVLMPDGTERVMWQFTDIFTPGVDFVSEFRFADGFEGSPAEGEHIFKFLNPMGDPLAGVEGVDVWRGCRLVAPLNVRASVGASGISVSWSPVPGFDPSHPDWFYQIEFGQESEEGLGYGSNHVKQTSHLMPFASFAPGSAGSPDGQNYGVGLRELPDGEYNLIVYVFVPAPMDSGGFGHECQMTAEDEWLTVVKSGSSFTIGD